MSLTITSEETCRLAAELVELTGETPDDVIAAALRDHLRRMRIVADRDVTIPGPGVPLAEGEELSITHGDYLYDEHGLPK